MLGKLFFLFCASSVVLALPYPSDVKETAKADDVDICSLPPVNPSPIACSGVIPRWTYNAKTGACERFIYGGCFGTENLFKNEFACLSRCNKEELQKLINESDSTSPCLLPKITGTCRAFIPSFYFDTTTGLCTAFTYTGCGGNANNFNSEEECDLKCNGLSGPVTPPTVESSSVSADSPADDEVKELTKQERCSLPPIKTEGPFSCLAFIPSWTFNSTSGQCQSYVYGGCGKTANLYDSEEACNVACGPELRMINPHQETCLLPVTKGPCFAFMPRYAFVKEKNRCERFIYGGCQGNKNNFKASDECYKTCGGDLPSTTPECEGVTCPVSNRRFIERGCRPEYKPRSCCPFKFICPEEKSVQGFCQYRGIFYSVGEQISQLHDDDACSTSCKCVESDEHRGGVTIKCDKIYCDMPFLPSPDCFLVSKPGQCCPSYKCPETSPDQAGHRNDTCTFKGKEYFHGQYIPSGDACRKCRCVEGFTGLDGLGCEDVHCVIENRIGCVPVYASGACCPISYKCLSDSELQQNKTRIIRLDPEPGKQGVTTLPIAVVSPRSKPRAVCFLPKEIGTCRMSKPSFYFDSELNKCVSFIYGGCQGNENRFSTIEECMNTCSKPASSDRYPDDTRIIHIQPAPGFQGVITLPIRVADDAPTSRARARTIDVQSSHQDVSTLPFILDGTNEINAKLARPEQCLLPKETGPCRMINTVYFFDVNKEKCVAFNYGGCSGNANRFKTIEQCRQTCGEPSEPDVCSLPVRQGRCKASIPSFYYNAETGSCDSFFYGGCSGNGNRFQSIESCQTTCVNKTQSQTVAFRARNDPVEDKFARCKLPADVGLCRAVKERFFYDSVDKECKTFTYGGCMGNANNFKTIEECATICIPDDPVYGVKARARARARARTLPGEEVEQLTNALDSGELVCKFGNVTLKLGESLVDSSSPCDECTCSTPPELTCVTQQCPPPPEIELALCQPEFTEGQCCPSYSCVSSNPPSINMCENVVCDQDEHCEVQAQESDDGNWMPPIGVCIKDSTSIPL